jgi:hypothetical protein
MPSLIEILKDPNYVNANEATKRAIFDKYSAQDQNYTGANEATKDAIRQKFGVITEARAEERQQPTAAPKERTLGEAAQDIGAGLVSGAGALAQLPGQIYGLATGDFSDTGLTKVGREMRETGESMKSEELKRREAERSSKIAAAEKEGQISAGVTAFMETIKDPALLTNFIAEQAPNLIPGLGVARGLKAAGMGAQAVRGAIGTGAVQQGADIGAQSYEELYKELKSKGMSDGEAAGRALGYARATGAGAAVISVLAQRLPGARAIEEAMAGVEGKAATGILAKAGRAGRAATGAAGEAGSEIVEETGGKFAQNVAMAQERPDFALSTGLGQTAGMAAVGGVGMGGVSGALSRGQVETLPPEKPPESPPEKPPEPPPEKPPGVETPPGAIFTPKLNRASDEEIKKLETYYEGKPEDFGLSLADIQNRDRSKPASIAQMQSIAANPNYDRISVSREFASGAPVVISDIQLPDTQLGKIETVTSEDNTRFPIRYAVVDAGQLTPSHLVDGTNVKAYSDASVEGIRPVAGNGRVAGLMQAYKQGTAEDYKTKMLEDTDHGINPEVIQQMDNPVLVRIMPKADLTANIADKSNVAGQMRMTPAEQAKVDLGRFDVTKVDFMADGAPSYESLVQFINSMPESERAELMDDGAPSKEAVTRLNNSIFSHAYDSPQLMRLFSQAIDPEAATVMRAIALAAPSMQKLNDAGEYDFRDRLINAAQEIVNARRRGISLATFRQQQDIDRDPYTAKIMDFFIDNLRAPRRMGEALTELADAAHAQSITGEDMFGEVPKVPMQDIFNRVFGGEPITQPFTQEPAAVAKPEVPEKIPFAIDKKPSEIAKEITGFSMPQLSQWLIDNAPNSAAKAIAEAITKRINEYADRNVSMTLEVQKGTKRKKGEFGSSRVIPATNGIAFVISLNSPFGPRNVLEENNDHPRGAGTNYRTIMHELLHLVTQVQLNLLPKTDPRIKELQQILNTVNKQIEKDIRAGVDHPFIKLAGTQSLKWGPKKDIFEIISWGLTDEDYQNYLSTVKVGDQNVFSKFVDVLRKLLGLKEQYQTALEAVAYITENLVTENVQETEKLAASRGTILGRRTPEKMMTPAQAFTSKDEVGSNSEIRKFLEEKWQRLVDGPQKTKPKGFDHVPDKLWDGLNPIFYPQGKTIFKKIDDMRPTFWKRLAQGVADQYRSIKDYSSEAYMLARMSKTVDGALEGLMFFGQVELDNGALNIKPNSKGLLDIFKPLGEEVDTFMIWQAMNRDAELAANKRAPSIAQSLVAQRKLLSDGNMPDGRNRLKVYESVQKELNQLNRSVLRIAYKQGLIDKKAFAVFSRDINYIPFYKVMEENGDVQAAATKSGLVNQYMSKALKGGEKPFGDLMENTLRNWSHILSASQKNAAAGATMKAAVEQGGAYPNLKSDLGWQDGKVYATRRMSLVDRINENDELSDSQKQSKINRIMKPYVDAINERSDIDQSRKDNLIEGLYEGLANGDGKLIPEMTTSEGKGISKIMIGGQPTYFKVEDELLMEAIASIGYMGPKSKFLDVARDFKNMLQFGVTISPAFKVRNLFRDSIAAMAVSDLKKQPWANVVKGWAESDRNNPAHISALAGGAIFNFGSAYEGDQAKMIRRLIKMGVKENDILDTPEKIKAGLTKMWDAYQDFGNKSESANRMALYTQLKEKGHNHLEASFYARDMLDFSMQGSWPAMRMVTQVVPFLNARVQGLYKLGRDGINPTARVIYNSVTGKPIELTDKQKAQQFSTVMTAVALASLMLYMAFKDDEEFKKREEWDRDNFWWFRLPGMETAIRVPKPFEIGAFGTMAERTAEQIMDKSAEGKTFEKSLKRMLTDTFAINPIPQMVRPLVDLYSNKDSFTGAPIETAGMERLSKEQRIAEKTSPLAIALSKVTNVFLPESAEVSPVQTDYAIKSYFGWLGGTASATSHYAVMPFSKSAYPDQDWKETMSLGFVKSLPTAQSKYVTAFYENNKEISQAYADMRHFMEIGEMDKAQKIMQEKGDKITLAKFYDKASKDMSKVRQVILHIRADETMTGAQKKEEIDRLKILIGEIAQQMEESRKTLSQP